jgi:hypothetical protein
MIFYFAYTAQRWYEKPLWSKHAFGYTIWAFGKRLEIQTGNERNPLTKPLKNVLMIAYYKEKPCH